MLPRLPLLLALTACGRLGFEGHVESVDAHDSPDAQDDAAGELGSVTCATVRSPIDDGNGGELIAEAASTPLIAWRSLDTTIQIALLDGDNVVNVMSPFTPSERLVGAYPIATGHALAIQQGNMELLYAISSDLRSAGIRGMGTGGVGHDSVTGFGGYVFWGDVGFGQPRSLQFWRLDDNGMGTLQSNRTASADVRDLVVTGAVDSHAHLVWAQADDTCVASELFEGIPDLYDVHTIEGCRSPRGASGVGDSVATAYATPSGALRFYTLSSEYEHDIELSPSAHDPTLADDGKVVWATWFDERVGGAVVIAKIELGATSAIVTARRLEAVTPSGPRALAFVGDSASLRLLVLEARAIAIVEPCI
jgi:hypothetical protein